jgi:hypothetical protein
MIQNGPDEPEVAGDGSRGRISGQQFDRVKIRGIPAQSKHRNRAFWLSRSGTG